MIGGRLRGRFVPGYGLLFGLAISFVTQSCQSAHRSWPATAFPPSDTVECTTSMDAADGDRFASGLFVHCSVSVDTAGPYYVDGQIYQDRERGEVSLANERGVDMSRSALRTGHPTRVYAYSAGPIPVTLWFPGSELRARARRGEAWVDIQVSDTTWFSPRASATPTPHAQRFFRCRIPRLDPSAFVTRLPGQDVPPPLPRPVRR